MQCVSLYLTCPILALQLGSRQRFAWPNRQIGGRSLGGRMFAFSANKGSLSHRETNFLRLEQETGNLCVYFQNGGVCAHGAAGFVE